MTVFLKFVHLAAIAIWSGGLLVLPCKGTAGRYTFEGSRIVA